MKKLKATFKMTPKKTKLKKQKKIKKNKKLQNKKKKKKNLFLK